MSAAQLRERIEHNFRTLPRPLGDIPGGRSPPNSAVSFHRTAGQPLRWRVEVRAVWALDPQGPFRRRRGKTVAVISGLVLTPSGWTIPRALAQRVLRRPVPQIVVTGVARVLHLDGGIIMSRQRLINETIPESHLDLLKRALKRVNEKRASVSMFERFGLSGAVLYRLTPLDSIPFVVKVDETRKIKREYDAADSVRNKFHDLHVEKPVGPTKEGQSALVYPLISVQGGIGRVVELKHKYEMALHGEAGALEEVVTAIRLTYGKCSVAHAFTRNDSVAKFGDHYGRYVGLKKNSTDRLKHLFESHGDPLVAYGVRFANPREVIERILDAPLRPLRVVATHGDLHPSNVVFSSSNDPRLIDFAHADRDQHLFKDFVTMESSLRFMMFPRHIHPALLGPIDRALNENWSCDTAQKLVKAAVPSEGARALGAMIACVHEVRTACDHALEQGGRKLSEDEMKEEYFRSLALLLLGQQQFDTFPLIRVAVNLHLLGELYA